MVGYSGLCACCRRAGQAACSIAEAAFKTSAVTFGIVVAKIVFCQVAVTLPLQCGAGGRAAFRQLNPLQAPLVSLVCDLAAASQAHVATGPVGQAHSTPWGYPTCVFGCLHLHPARFQTAANDHVHPAMCNLLGQGRRARSPPGASRRAPLAVLFYTLQASMLLQTCVWILLQGGARGRAAPLGLPGGRLWRGDVLQKKLLACHYRCCEVAACVFLFKLLKEAPSSACKLVGPSSLHAEDVSL